MNANELLESTRRVAEAISADPKANARAKLLAERFRRLDVALSTGGNLPDEWDWEPGQVTHEEVVVKAQPVGTVAPIEYVDNHHCVTCGHLRTHHNYRGCVLRDCWCTGSDPMCANCGCGQAMHTEPNATRVASACQNRATDGCERFKAAR